MEIMLASTIHTVSRRVIPQFARSTSIRFITLPNRVVELTHEESRRVQAEQKEQFTKEVRELVKTEPAVIVPLTTDSLEWTLSSPPPLHQFEEPPLFVETEHLGLHPGVEVETLLKERVKLYQRFLVLNKLKDEAEFEGKIP